MADLRNRQITNTKKKRTLDEISNIRASQSNLATDPDLEAAPKIDGRFRFKFKEGHSKNFKREINFDWFTNGK